MQVLGIDPGVATTGYGLITQLPNGEIETVKYGVIRTKAGISLPERLQTLYEELQNILLLHQPQHAAVEKLFFQRNVTTAIAVGEARGICLLALSQAHISIGEYTPLEVKQAVTGYGAADKHQVQVMVQTLLQLKTLPKPDDAADALAVAFCHMSHLRYQQAAL
jgi:crossover junction endodeoxyribonuclease RuvC